MKKGLLITLEGPDGSGKTTQMDLLKKHFDTMGYEYIVTREPGGTEIGEKIREIVLSNDNTEMCSTAEALLYAASRAQLVKEIIKPAINNGKIVLCDRFVYSSLVYQGIGRNLGVEKVKYINDMALDGLKPDIIIMLSIDYEEGLRRKKSQKVLDRLENSGDEFHKKVFDGYFKISEIYDKINIIDANRDVNEINRDIIKIINKLL